VGGQGNRVQDHEAAVPAIRQARRAILPLLDVALVVILHILRDMSRAFVNEDAGGWGDPSKRFTLPDRDDPEFDRAAAEALLEAARAGDTGSAEMATGYYWGEPRLRPHVERLLARALREKDDRLEQLARRFLG
jgi:hypothetical protein